ncbi:MAG: serine/threonine protein phosphatase [Rhizobiales bacterium]|nr:serine/threonine protein phosphatase [Hyphomicrobiales bacterium]
MTPVHYAIGDIHGRDDLLELMHQRIAGHRELNFADRAATIVHVGDYIDRGPDSRAVIDRLMRGVAGFETVCLRGNHEDLMLACLATDDRDVWRAWLSNAGDATLASFDVSNRLGRYDRRDLVEALGKDRIAWLHALPLHHIAGDHLFVHAGIVPGRPIEEQLAKDLLWIRYRFLDSLDDHGYRVIHGHTPGDEPVVRPNRICIDTGAPFSGRLTAVVLDGANEPEFLTVQGVTAR